MTIGTQSMSLIANFPHSPSQEAPLYEAAQEIEYLEKGHTGNTTT